MGKNQPLDQKNSVKNPMHRTSLLDFPAGPIVRAAIEAFLLSKAYQTEQASGTWIGSIR